MRRCLRKISEKSGTTLIEMIVSMLLLEILAVMVIGVLSPASKMFVRVQKMQFAQMIVDNVAEEMKTQLQEAVGAVRIYENDVFGRAGASGTVLEYMNTDGYVVLMSADGCGATSILRGSQQSGAPIKIEPPVGSGKLLMRYYWPTMSENGNTYNYHYTQGGALVARTVNRMFTDKYYMGHYLKVRFEFPDGVGEEGEVRYLKANLSLYKEEECQTLLAEEDIVLDIRYKTRRVRDAERTAVPGE